MQLCWKVPWSLGNYSSQACRVETSGKDLGKMWSFQTTPTPAKSFRSMVTICIYVKFVIFWYLTADSWKAWSGVHVSTLLQDRNDCAKLADSNENSRENARSGSAHDLTGCPRLLGCCCASSRDFEHFFCPVHRAPLFRDYSNLIDILCSQSAVSGG